MSVDLDNHLTCNISHYADLISIEYLIYEWLTEWIHHWQQTDVHSPSASGNTIRKNSWNYSNDADSIEKLTREHQNKTDLGAYKRLEPHTHIHTTQFTHHTIHHSIFNTIHTPCNPQNPLYIIHVYYISHTIQALHDLYTPHPTQAS